MHEAARGAQIEKQPRVFAMVPRRNHEAESPFVKRVILQRCYGRGMQLHALLRLDATMVAGERQVGAKLLVDKIAEILRFVVAHRLAKGLADQQGPYRSMVSPGSPSTMP